MWWRNESMGEGFVSKPAWLQRSVSYGKHLLVRIVRRCWIPLAIGFIILAVLFSLFRLLTPVAKQYKGDVEQHLSSLMGQPVKINSMETSWYWFEPVLKLNQVTVFDTPNHVLKLAKLLVGINLFSSLWHGHIQPGILYIEDVHLVLHEHKDHWQIEGVREDRQVTSFDPESYLPVLRWLLDQQKIILKNLSATVYLQDGSVLPFSMMTMTAVNSHGHYRLKGEAQLAQTLPTHLLILADLHVNPSALSQGSGQVYLSLREVSPTQWHTFFRNAPYSLHGGKGNVEIWLDLKKGRLTSVQSRFHLRHTVFTEVGALRSQWIQSLKANVAWSPTATGWVLSSDHLKLRAGGVRWPENSAMLQHIESEKVDRLFVKKLLLKPLWQSTMEWPVALRPLLAMHPRGQLHDLQLDLQSGHMIHVLTRFSGLGWDGRRTLPGVRHLSGVLNGGPTEGRLELDGEGTTIAFSRQLPLVFKELNAAFEWKALSHGLRVSMERFLLTRPDLIVSARGALDEPFSPEARALRLTAEFSAEHAHQWLQYLPSGILKPKLEKWLRHDIKQVDKASGQLILNGRLAAFPFDREPGDFSVVTRVSGMDLSFHKRWPLIRHIDMTLRVNKRTLELDVLHASLLGIEAHAANLRVDDLGLNHEALLLHGHALVPSKALKEYVLATPLATHLSKLGRLDMDGSLGLDLNLEVPLYPENDTVLARGALVFDDNTAVFHHAMNNVLFKHLSGTLHFDEQGAVDSALKATLLGAPVAMHIQSVHSSSPYTSVTVEGDTTIDFLRDKFDFPLWSLMEGHLTLVGQLTLTDDPNDLDSLAVSSSLEGMSLDLPKPFGKTPSERRPLQIQIGFNPEKSIRLQVHYGRDLASDLVFYGHKNQFQLNHGEIHLGVHALPWGKKPGLRVAGFIPQIVVSDWQKAWPTGRAEISSMLDALRVVDVTLGTLDFLGKRYPQVGIKAIQAKKDTWSVVLNQEDVAGDLLYQPVTHTLSGHLSKLYLSKSGDHQGPSIFTRLKPQDIPNLKITCDQLKWGDLALGSLQLKSTSTISDWHLDSSTITSPAYRLTMTGDWWLHGTKSNTELQADLKMNNLAESLAAWHMTPAVEAKKGQIQFQGGWLGALHDGSLSRLNGKVYVKFSNGRITHLSPETEEKLGLGKLLSILSLQTIPRRLQLDFSDLSSTGYSYDVFQGNFTLKNGVMNTDDSYIDGPVAYVGMKGDLDVVKQLYDLELHVSPHITASLPVVATIAGGPIAGMAAWIASKLINQGMQRVTGYTYKVSGPWLDPVVQQVSIKKVTGGGR